MRGHDEIPGDYTILNGTGTTGYDDRAVLVDTAVNSYGNQPARKC